VGRLKIDNKLFLFINHKMTLHNGSIIKSLYDCTYFKWTKPTPPTPKECPYEKRIECFQKLADLQRQLKAVDYEYVNVSIIEGKVHENALNRLEYYTKEYKNEYKRCQEIIKE